jgi:dihydrofolate reductase
MLRTLGTGTDNCLLPAHRSVPARLRVFIADEEAAMARLRVHNLSMSLDGFVAGPRQSVDDPLGVGGEQLHEWIFADPADAVDADFVHRSNEGIGATVMGRNMFTPVRGPWPDDTWRGWWGEEPPFHHPVFVLTHHARDPVELQGGTTFHFVTEGVDAALDRAFDAAGGKDVRLGGGASAVRQCLRAGLVDELHVAVVPLLLGDGERLFDGVGDRYACVEHRASPAVTHVVLRRRP